MSILSARLGSALAVRPDYSRVVQAVGVLARSQRFPHPSSLAAIPPQLQVMVAADLGWSGPIGIGLDAKEAREAGYLAGLLEVVK